MAEQRSATARRGCGTALAVVVGLISTVVAYGHMCARGAKWFENSFPFMMAVVYGVIVYRTRRMELLGL